MLGATKIPYCMVIVLAWLLAAVHHFKSVNQPWACREIICSAIVTRSSHHTALVPDMRQWDSITLLYPPTFSRSSRALGSGMVVWDEVQTISQTQRTLSAGGRTDTHSRSFDWLAHQTSLTYSVLLHLFAVLDRAPGMRRKKTQWIQQDRDIDRSFLDPETTARDLPSHLHNPHGLRNLPCYSNAMRRCTQCCACRLFNE